MNKTENENRGPWERSDGQDPVTGLTITYVLPSSGIPPKDGVVRGSFTFPLSQRIVCPVIIRERMR